MDSVADIVVEPQADFFAIKAKQKAIWEDGDYHAFSRYMQPGAEEILLGWDIDPSAAVLDVGCGSGQTAIPAARRGLRVTGVDIAENLIAQARRNAQAENLQARFEVADAEALPFADASFDVVISLIGAMFAPQPSRVVAEFARVLRPGGRLYMANWTMHGMPAHMFRYTAEVMPPPAGLESPLLWGDEATVQQRLQSTFTDIKLSRKNYPQWHYPFDEYALVQLFREQFGPVKRAFEMASPAQAETLRQKLATVYREHGRLEAGALTITGGEYLEVIATRTAYIC